MSLRNSLMFAKDIAKKATFMIPDVSDEQIVVLESLIDQAVEPKHNNRQDVTLFIHRYVHGTMLEIKAVLYGESGDWETIPRSKSMGSEMTYHPETGDLIYHGAIKLKRVPSGIVGVTIGML